MRSSGAYEWLLKSCLQECRKGIFHLEQIADADPPPPTWLREDLAQLLALESATQHSLATLRRSSDAVGDTPCLPREQLDRLQSKLLESFQHLATEGVQASNGMGSES